MVHTTKPTLEEFDFIIYCLTNTANGKRYVGQTKTTLQKRWYKHRYMALVKHANTRLYEAIRKHGHDVFTLVALQRFMGTQSMADEFESTWIRAYDSTHDEKGYNMTSGGNTRAQVKMSSDVCEKIRLSKLGKPLVTRTRKTDERHLPIVEGFKIGKSRKELAEEFGIRETHVVKILLRWKRLHDPDLAVGPEHQYASSGASLQRNALERNQRMIDMVTKEGKSRKEVAVELGVSYGLVKNVLLRHRRKIWSVEPL